MQPDHTSTSSTSDTVSTTSNSSNSSNSSVSGKAGSSGTIGLLGGIGTVSATPSTAGRIPAHESDTRGTGNPGDTDGTRGTHGTGGAGSPGGAGAPTGTATPLSLAGAIPRARTGEPPATTDPLTRLLGETAAVRHRVLRHDVYRGLTGLGPLRVFMEHHVFAVWDFMSLLKALQRDLTCVQVPWTPRGTPEVRRMINEIVLGEESDTTSRGPRSHFELYLEAMDEAGADTGPARRFLTLLAEGVPVADATGACGAPPGAAAFVRRTWRVVEQAPLHCLAAAFALGREELIPRMFDHFTALDLLDDDRLSAFREYLQRHIEVDGDEHGPMALRLLSGLCAGHPDPARAWRESTGTVTVALRARADLWDSVTAALAATPA